jgi:hypothetical protein
MSTSNDFKSAKASLPTTVKVNDIPEEEQLTFSWTDINFRVPVGKKTVPLEIRQELDVSGAFKTPLTSKAAVSDQEFSKSKGTYYK